MANAGTITRLTNDGAIDGGPSGDLVTQEIRRGGAGVSNTGSINELTNRGAIIGGANGSSAVGLSNAGTITTLTNDGAIDGGGSAGGGVSNTGSIKSFTNRGKIAGAAGQFFGGGVGGTGLFDAGKIDTLSNAGAIVGGNAADSRNKNGSSGGAGIIVIGVATIKTINNEKGGTIVGGKGGDSGTADSGGAGVLNEGLTPILSNDGVIQGGEGATHRAGTGGTGGVGIRNSGTITLLENTGVIQGGKGGPGRLRTVGPAGAAIDNTGGSIGKIDNSGRIIGDVVSDQTLVINGSLQSTPVNSGRIVADAVAANQTSATVTPGSFTDGAITIDNGDLTFASGKTFLGDSISVKGGAGTVTNKCVLELDARETINGNFDQTHSGEVDFLISGDAPGDYGALAVMGLAKLDGRFALDLEDGFSLSAGESFDVITFAGVKNDFRSLSLDGTMCSENATDLWSCSNLAGLSLEEVFSANSLELEVVTGSVSPSPVPEPSTWAMLVIGFTTLGLAASRARRVRT